MKKLLGILVMGLGLVFSTLSFAAVEKKEVVWRVYALGGSDESFFSKKSFNIKKGKNDNYNSLKIVADKVIKKCRSTRQKHRNCKITIIKYQEPNEPSKYSELVNLSGINIEGVIVGWSGLDEEKSTQIAKVEERKAKKQIEEERKAREQKGKEERKAREQKRKEERIAKKQKREIEREGIVAITKDDIIHENEYALLLGEQHKFVKREKKLILNDIDKAKKLCEEMGFTEGIIFKNQEFSKCVLKVWETELIGKKYAAMEKEFKEIKELNETLRRQSASVSQSKIARKKSKTSSDFTNSLIKGALGLAASYYLGKALSGGSKGSQGSKGDPGITVRGYRCTLHPTAFDC